MSEITKKFSIDDVQMYRNDEDMDFAEVELWALAEGNNSHNNPFSKEVLEKYAETFLGKFVVAKYEKWKGDVTTHVPDEAIIGYIDPRETIEFKEKEVDGVVKEFVVVKGLLSKIYATEVVEMFKTNNMRTVSCEFSCSLQYEENNEGVPLDDFKVPMYGVENPVLSYTIHGITVLGLDFKPSVKGTEIKVKRFAEEVKSPLKSFADERRNKLNNKEDKMEDTKKFESKATDEKEKDIVMEEDKEKEMSAEQSDNKEEVKEEDKKEMSAETEEKVEEDKKEMSEDDTKEMSDEEDKEMSDDAEKEMAEEDKEMSEDEDKEMGCGKEMSEEDTKQFSLDAFADNGAVLALLENETEQNRELAQRVLSMSAEDVVKTVLEFSNQVTELKEFQEKVLSEQKDSKLATIMASVKEDLDEKTFGELQEEGKTLTFEELGGFENKVKAFAYEASKNKETKKEESEIMTFAGVVSEQQEEDLDVFDRISRK